MTLRHDTEDLRAATDMALTNQFSQMRHLLAQIAADIAPATPPGLLRLDATVKALTIGIRTQRFVFSCADTALITLKISNETFLFHCLADMTYDVPFPYAIGSGSDVSVTASGEGVLGTCYFIYEPDRRRG